MTKRKYKYAPSGKYCLNLKVEDFQCVSYFKTLYGSNIFKTNTELTPRQQHFFSRNTLEVDSGKVFTCQNIFL